MAQIIALINNKGGVGKTTTAVNLAAAVARTFRRVLLVDIDTQASASLALGVPRSELSPSLAEALFRQLPIHQTIRKTGIEMLDLITGSLDLANTDLRLANIRGRENQLRDLLANVDTQYDYIIIDCPPSTTLLPVNAMVAADAFLVPVVPEYLSLEGLATLDEVVERMRTGMGIKGHELGIVLTMVDYRLKSTSEVVEMVRSHGGDRIFDTEIRVNVKLKEAPSYGQSIFDFAPDTPAAEAYHALAGEVIRRMQVLQQGDDISLADMQADAAAIEEYSYTAPPPADSPQVDDIQSQLDRELYNGDNPYRDAA